MEALQRDGKALRELRRLETAKQDSLFQSLQSEVENVFQQHCKDNIVEKMRSQVDVMRLIPCHRIIFMPQIDSKLVQLETVLRRIQIESNREDKFTKLFKTVISTMQ
jgi:hypothetical protein